MVLVAIFILLFIAISALAIDISNLYAIRNELQNAADAGALAGARMLYTENGLVNPNAVNIATSAAKDNIALSIDGSKSVDVFEGDVKIGHWAFGIGDLKKGFNGIEILPTEPPELMDVSTKDLDQNEDFVNAVQVVSRRGRVGEGSPAPSFFARIFGYDKFFLYAKSTAYIGFAGTVQPGDVDQPIALCIESLEDGCKNGRFMNSSDKELADTARWVNFVQPCEGGGGIGKVENKVCAGGNENPLTYGIGMISTNGEVEDALKALIESDCWGPWRENNQSWPMTLPVVECLQNSPSCSKLLGIVDVHVLWIQRKKLSDKAGEEGPLSMKITNPKSLLDSYDPTDDGPEFSNFWVCDESDVATPNTLTYKKCWNKFVRHYNLLTKKSNFPYVEIDIKEDPLYEYPDAGDHGYITLKDSELANTIFFLPECEFQQPTGNTGGQNFGILAKIPVLVE